MGSLKAVSRTRDGGVGSGVLMPPGIPSTCCSAGCLCGVSNGGGSVTFWDGNYGYISIYQYIYIYIYQSAPATK